MEGYILYSIIIFSSFIFLLYIYLLYEKVTEIFEINKRKKYEKEVNPLIDKLIIKIEENFEYEDIIDQLSNMAKDSVKRRLIIERIILYNELYSGEIRKKIAEMCEKTGLVDYEIKELKNKDKFKIAFICKNLGEFRSKKAIEPLLKLRNIDNVDTKYHVLMALAKIGELEPLVQAIEGEDDGLPFSERSLTEIIDSFEGNKSELYKRMIYSNNIFLSTIIIKSAANYMDAEINDHIKNFLEDTDKERRIAAIKAIGQNSDTRFIDILIKKLEDEEWEVRASAGKSLGRIGDNRALKALSKALSDSSWWVRYNSANAILELPDGINYLQIIMEGEDRFAKDSIISALEGGGMIDQLLLYENTEHIEKKTLAGLIKSYISDKTKQVKS